MTDFSIEAIAREIDPAAFDSLASSNSYWRHGWDNSMAAFTRACIMRGIEDLHLHDLRREGVSRLFELGWTIPQVASVSGHRSWSSLKIYTNIDEIGDKWANWKWLDVVCR